MTEQAAKYCRAVYEAGFSPVCPGLFYCGWDTVKQNVPEHLQGYFDYESYGRDIHLNQNGHFAPGGYALNNGGKFIEHYSGLADIPPEHRIFSYPQLNVREQMAAYQEVIDRSALNGEKQRLPVDREDR